MGNDKDSTIIPNIASVPVEEDSPENEQPSPKARVELLQAERAEDRKDADSDHARKRDTWVTIAGFILIFVLIIGYFIAVGCFPDNEHITSLLDLIKTVVLLIIGYIFGTKITHR
jgi:hypothetical protein